MSLFKKAKQTATTQRGICLSKCGNALLIISVCPSVIGSKVPGKRAMRIWIQLNDKIKNKSRNKFDRFT